MSDCVIADFADVILCCYEDNSECSESSVFNNLFNCNWQHVLNADNSLATDSKAPIEDYEKKLAIAVSCLLSYCQENITGPDLQQSFNNDLCIKDARNLLSSDSEDLNVLIKHPELLLVAETVLTNLSTRENNNKTFKYIALWWLLRCLLIHQQSLDEHSQTLYSKLENCIKQLDELLVQLKNSDNVKDRKFAVMLCLEICQVYLFYKRIEKSNIYLNKAKNLYEIKLDISGALGKRTQYQQKDVAQLKLLVKFNHDNQLIENSEVTHKFNPPKLLKLNDDLRLEEIKFTEEQKLEQLPSLAQAIILCSIYYHKLSQPKDELTSEELKAYITVLLKQTNGPWQIRFNALIALLDIEKSNKRTVERSMLQCEELVKLQKNIDTPVRVRLSYLFMSGAKLKWHTKRIHADLMLSLGLVKTALDTYLDLQLWEDVILCYTLLELKHKAAEVIRECLAAEETVKMLCLLGDVTDDIECYKKAWALSNEKSSKAQRHWGNNLYCKAKYEEAISHFEKSLELNSLQESVWLRLGYAALSIENWETAANAYRNYTYLEQREFEAWNNLAKAYIKLGDKDRAHKVLTEALKCNYDNWQVWENMLIVSVDTGNFSDAIRAYERLIDLRGKHLDVEILEILAKVIVDEKLDAHGQNSKRFLERFQKLMGRISVSHQNEFKVWLIYASLPLKDLLICPKLLKAYRCLTQGGNWTADPKICEEVMNLCLDMARLVLNLDPKQDCYSDTDKNEIRQQLSSVRLSCKSAHSAIQKARMECESAEKKLPQLQEYIDTLTQRVTSFL